MKNISIFCFGFGQVAKYFVKNLIKNNFNFDLITTNTIKTETKEFDKIKHKSYYFNNNEFDNDLLIDLYSSNKLLFAIFAIISLYVLHTLCK